MQSQGTTKSQSKIQKFLREYRNHEFESSTETTKEFKSFSTKFKNVIKAILEDTNPNFVLDSYNVGHFYVSGFIQNKENGKLVYFSLSDVRGGCFCNHLLSNVLVRTAQHNKDFSGGSNNYTSLEEFGLNITRLLN